MAAITIQDLENAKTDVDHMADIATSLALTATDRMGHTKRTIAGLFADMDQDAADQRTDIQAAADIVLAGLGYAPPVAYAAGINLTQLTQTVEYNGEVYAPKVASLPFTTSGTFETANFRLIQGVAGVDLAASGGSSLVGHIGGGTGARTRTVQSKLRDFVSVKDFGAIADGTNHPLSERYASLAAAQVDYPFVTALTQSIDWAACMAATLAADHGGRVYLPTGKYYLSDTWKVYKQVTIQGAHFGVYESLGATRIIAAANIDAIWFQSGFDTGNSDRADCSTISDLQILCASKLVSGRGIYATTTIRVDQVFVKNFASHGIHIKSAAASVGIADAWSVTRSQIVQNGGHGLFLEGSDSQIGMCSLTRIYGNALWGVRDQSPYHNLYLEVQVEANTTGNWYLRNKSLIISCYSEAGYGASDLGGDAMVIGGNMDNFGSLGSSGTKLFNSDFGGTDGWILPNGRKWAIRKVTDPATSTSVEQIRLDPGGGSGTGLLLFNGLQYIAKDATNPGIVYGQLGGGYLQVHNDNTTAARSACIFSNANGTVGTISTSGSATAYNTSSDYRLKENVQPMAGAEAIARVMALKPVKYTWKADGTDGEGFIAHELQSVCPQAVSGEKDEMQEVDIMEEVDLTDAEGNKIGTEIQKTGSKIVPKYQGVDTSFLVATLVSAFQELKQDFDSYKTAHP